VAIVTSRKFDAVVKTVDGDEMECEIVAQAAPVPGAVEAVVMSRLYDDHAIVVYSWEGRIVIPASAIVWLRIVNLAEDSPERPTSTTED
jgi:hypothetical protein